MGTDKRYTTGKTRAMHDSNQFESAPREATAGSQVWAMGEEILSSLPNDLTRLIYLTSIRDSNSGTYRHHVLSREFDPMEAHSVLEAWHQQVFARLITSPVPKFVEELEGYLRYSRAERERFITAWKTLQVYRAAIPLQAPRRAREIFFLNVATALNILERLNRAQS